MSEPQRWRITLEYDGSGFVGWQRQRNGISVQATVESALEVFLGHPVQLSGSGRTDAGVHALGQVASFLTSAHRSPENMVIGLNHYLPDTIACVEAQTVQLEFDPRRWARRKLYRYQFLDRPGRSPLLGSQSHHVRWRLDVDAMNKGVKHLIGLHDFSSFRAARCTATHPVRIVQDATVRREGRLVLLEVEGNAFLRHMVRIIAGTLLEVGMGRRPADWVLEVLNAKSRKAAGNTAPAHGLTKVWVRFGQGPNPGYGEPK